MCISKPKMPDAPPPPPPAPTAREKTAEAPQQDEEQRKRQRLGARLGVQQLRSPLVTGS